MFARRRRLVVAGLLVLVLGSGVACGRAADEPVATGSATGAPSPAADERTPVEDPSEDPAEASGLTPAELEDLRFLAEQEGITLEAAIARYGWQNGFAAAVDEIRGVTADLASSGIDSASGAWVLFAGSAPEAATPILDRFAAAHPQVTVEVRTGAGYSERAVEEAVVRVHQAVNQAPGVEEAASSFESSERRISTTVVVEPGASADTMADLQSVSNAALGAEFAQASGISTTVTQASGPLGRNDAGDPAAD